jgi:hypothetical protein
MRSGYDYAFQSVDVHLCMTERFLAVNILRESMSFGSLKLSRSPQCTAISLSSSVRWLQISLWNPVVVHEEQLQMTRLDYV